MAIGFGCLAASLHGVWAQAQNGTDAAADTGQQADHHWAVLDRYCTGCHNFFDWAGGVAFDALDRNDLQSDAEVWEAAIRKLRTGLMPPLGEPRPARALLDDLAHSLESGLDLAWVAAPNPGAEGLSRLNRSEYANAIRDLLAFDASVIAGTLPAGVSAGGFDTIAEALSVSPTLLEAYIAVATSISRQALGDLEMAPTQIVYSNRLNAEAQRQYVEGLPLGTRGGMVVEHYFPLDAEYAFRVSANMPVAGRDNDAGRMVWCDGPALVVDFNGVPVEVEDPQRFRLRVPAGSHRIGLALFDSKRCVGVGELLLGDATTASGAVQGIEIDGPYRIEGAGDTPSRRAILTCEPDDRSEAAAARCARIILSRLATRAYRRPVQQSDPELDALMQFYAMGYDEGGTFETGIRYALAWLLVDPQFLFRFEAEPQDLSVGEMYRISDLELATRLSFFLWSSIPDDELLGLAIEQRLGDEAVLRGQVRRMLADPRSSALVENFAWQWLKLRALDESAPQDSAFDESLRAAFRNETRLFLNSVLGEQRSLLQLLEADYTYLNQQLAEHYGIEGVWGSHMRRVTLPADSPRRGLLGQGSILTATSAPNRTSPVIRGEWVVHNLLGATVPPPPPGVEADLGDEDEAVSDAGEPTTLRERLESHLTDAACASCHQLIDPIGFALENFDLVGRWRETESGFPLDTKAQMVDGTEIDGPFTLRRALLARSDAFMTSIAGNLLTYGLGRELEHYDMPAVRDIARHAAANGQTFGSLVEAVVLSLPFQHRLKTGEGAE